MALVQVAVLLFSPARVCREREKTGGGGALEEFMSIM